MQLSSIYEKFKSQVNKDYMVYIDYSLPSYKKRLFVYDLNKKEVIREHHVAHGTKSTGSSPEISNRFSNLLGSRQSSLGAMRTGKVYYGKYGKSLRLHGLEKGINNLVYLRSIVVHPSNYVTDEYIQAHGYAGRSWGCLAVDPSISSSLIDLIKEGTLVYADY